MASLIRTFAAALFAVWGACMAAPAHAQPAPVSDWSGVARVVTFGDLTASTTSSSPWRGTPA